MASTLTSPSGGTLLTDGYETPEPASNQPDQVIMSVQQALISKGYTLERDAPNGILGPRTKQALSAFQKENGIEPTGEPDPETLSILMRKPDAEVVYGAPNA